MTSFVDRCREYYAALLSGELERSPGITAILDQMTATLARTAQEMDLDLRDPTVAMAVMLGWILSDIARKGDYPEGLMYMVLAQAVVESRP